MELSWGALEPMTERDERVGAWRVGIGELDNGLIMSSRSRKCRQPIG